MLCAGFGTSGPIAEYPIRRFDRQVEVNLRAPFLLIQDCLPSLRQAAVLHPSGGPRIAAITSLTPLACQMAGLASPDLFVFPGDR